MKTILKTIISQLITWEARAIINKYKPKIVAVTGNVGKTSTKDAIYAVISKKFHTRKSEKSFNSDIGVPLSILGCENAWSDWRKWLKNIFDGLSLIFSNHRYPEWLVLEVGADRPGDIKKIAQWLKPDTVVVTKFAKTPVHIEYFKSRDELIAEKRHLAEALKHDGLLVLNSDDVDVYTFKNKIINRIVTFGFLGEAEVRASNYSIYYREGNELPAGINFKVEINGNCLPVNLLGTLGVNNIYSSLAAIAVGIGLGLNPVEAISNLNGFIPPRGRMNLIAGVKGTLLVDDTYNSSPVALCSALETLRQVKTKKRRVAVLGDMLELGRHSTIEHKEAGALAAKSCDLLVTVGLRSRVMAESALDNGLTDDQVLQFDGSVEAGEYLKKIIKPGDIVLVKGSQSMRMEKVVKELMAEPERAPELLVRQEEEWLKR